MTACAPDTLGLTWPISGTGTPDRLSSPFGPRIRGSGSRYDFHRGIDIPAPYGSPVFAAAIGTVVIAGVESDLTVQLAHCKPVQSTDLSSCDEYFYTRYVHLSRLAVFVGKTVRRGEVIGYSGVSATGVAHVHFELRDGSSQEGYGVNPLRCLPYNNRVPLGIAIDDVSAGDDAVAVTVTSPGDELDFAAVEIDVLDATSGAVIDSDRFDVEEINRRYAERTRSLESSMIDNVKIAPEIFSLASDQYRVSYRFTGVPIDSADVRVVARAIDVTGDVAAAECGPCP